METAISNNYCKAPRNLGDLFLEVPSCSGDQCYGNTVFYEELLVEAVEHIFEPGPVYNNRAGKDSKLLKKFDKPVTSTSYINYRYK